MCDSRMYVVHESIICGVWESRMQAAWKIFCV